MKEDKVKYACRVCGKLDCDAILYGKTCENEPSKLETQDEKKIETSRNSRLVS